MVIIMMKISILLLSQIKVTISCEFIESEHLKKIYDPNQQNQVDRFWPHSGYFFILII